MEVWKEASWWELEFCCCHGWEETYPLCVCVWRGDSGGREGGAWLGLGAAKVQGEAGGKAGLGSAQPWKASMPAKEFISLASECLRAAGVQGLGSCQK